MDQLGRNVVDCLNTGYKMRDEKKMLATYRHDGAWNLDDPADENRFTMEAWGAQMELRAIQRRNGDATVKTRAAGRPKGKSSYGFQYVRKVRGGKADEATGLGVRDSHRNMTWEAQTSGWSWARAIRRSRRWWSSRSARSIRRGPR